MKFKKSLALSISVPIAAIMLVNSAFAAPTISTTMGPGIAVSGSLSTFSTSGMTATTSCGNTQCYVYAEVSLTIKNGDTKVVSEKTGQGSNYVTAYAYAYTNSTSDQFISATGEHRASVTIGDSNHKWSGSTNR